MIAASNFVNPMHNGTATPATTTTTTLGNVENITINNNNNNNNDNNNSPIINSDQRIDFSHENLVLNNNNNNINNNSSNDNKLTNQNHLHNNNNNNNNEQNIKFDNSADKTAAAGQPENEKEEEEDDDDESVDITISNVVTNFSVGCHLNLRQIAYTGSNVIYKREQSIVLMKLRNPSVTASIWSSGKITCTGATTEESAKCGSRKVARCLQKLGFRTKFKNYRIVNVLGSCRLPFGIKIHEFSAHHRTNASYEPELHPGATYRIKELKAVQKIFQTGSITITAPSIRNVQLSVEHIYPLVHEFRKPKPPQSINNKKSDTINLKNNNNHTYNHAFGHDETNNKEDDEDGVDIMMDDEELLINNNIDHADSDSD